MISDFFSLPLKNLKHRGIRSWLTLLGIFIGIMAVVSLITLGSGLKTAVMSQFGVSSTEIITVQAGGLTGYGPPGTGVVNPLTEEDVEEIQKLSSVERVIPRYVPSGKLEFNQKVIFGFAMSIPEGENRKFVYNQLDIEAETGRLLKDGDNNKVVLGYNFYVDKVGLGKKITPGSTIILQDKKFQVVGITKKKGSFILDNVVYVNEAPLKELMNISDEVDIIVVQVKNKDVMERAKEDIEKLLRKRRDVKKGEEDFEVQTPEASLATVNSILGGVQIFIIVIASMSILVGSIGIVNTMTTSVLERKKQIGIMKAIGARNSDIFYQFFIEAGLMGLIGGIFGVIFGLLVGYLGIAGINSFIGATTQPRIDLIFIALVLFGSFLIGSISGIAPAMRAARQKPVEVLRG